MDADEIVLEQQHKQQQHEQNSYVFPMNFFICIQFKRDVAILHSFHYCFHVNVCDRILRKWTIKSKIFVR